MNSETKYSYQKRIRDLERDLKLERDRANKFQFFALEVFDWLSPFGKNDAGTPNAAFGIALFRRFIRDFK